jgi:predicted small lipoprotein YifL
MKKKLFTLVALAAMTLSMTACGLAGKNNAAETATEEAPATEAVEAAPAPVADTVVVETPAEVPATVPAQ